MAAGKRLLLVGVAGFALTIGNAAVASAQTAQPTCPVYGGVCPGGAGGGAGGTVAPVGNPAGNPASAAVGSGTPVRVSAPVVASQPEALAFTGSATGPLVGAALFLLALGAMLLRVGRDRDAVGIVAAAAGDDVLAGSPRLTTRTKVQLRGLLESARNAFQQSCRMRWNLSSAAFPAFAFGLTTGPPHQFATPFTGRVTLVGDRSSRRGSWRAVVGGHRTH